VRELLSIGYVERLALRAPGRRWAGWASVAGCGATGLAFPRERSCGP